MLLFQNAGLQRNFVAVSENLKVSVTMKKMDGASSQPNLQIPRQAWWNEAKTNWNNNRIEWKNDQRRFTKSKF